MLSLLWNLFYYASVVLGICSLGSMILMQLYQLILWYAFPLKDFKQCYGDWAIVTGSSSGIGKAITEMLAKQNVNVVLVALKDDLLTNTVAEFRKKYPDVEFRECGCNLGATDPKDYMQPIIATTQGIDVRILINNAAFINFGFFLDTNIERMRSNMICNASSSVEITHYFGKLMATTEKKSSAGAKKGFIGFTSSCGSYMPSPTAMLYGPTKSFLSNFGVSLAAENFDLGLDCLIVHPGPVSTSFYNNAAGLPVIEATKQLACGPEQIAKCFFVGAGRVMVYEQGLLTIGFKLLNKMLDYTVVSEIFRLFANKFPDHEKCVQRSQMRNAKKE